MADDASRWRALAAEARRVAAEMTEREARQTMLEIAEGYERLAHYADPESENPRPEYFDMTRVPEPAYGRRVDPLCLAYE